LDFCFQDSRFEIRGVRKINIIKKVEYLKIRGPFFSGSPPRLF
jgi:hypothetical protein